MKSVSGTPALCGVPIVAVQESAENLAAPDWSDRRRLFPVRIKDAVANALVRPLGVVVALILGHEVVELIQAEADEVVETLGLKVADVGFAIPVHLWTVNHRLDDLPGFLSWLLFDKLTEKVVKLGRVFRVLIMDKEPHLQPFVLGPHGEAARLLHDLRFVRIQRDGRTIHASRTQVDEEQAVRINTSTQGPYGLRKEIRSDNGLEAWTCDERPVRFKDARFGRIVASRVSELVRSGERLTSERI